MREGEGDHGSQREATSLLTLGPPDLDNLLQLCRLTYSSLSLYQAVCFGLVPLKKALSSGQRRRTYLTYNFIFP